LEVCDVIIKFLSLELLITVKLTEEPQTAEIDSFFCVWPELTPVQYSKTSAYRLTPRLKCLCLQCCCKKRSYF